MSRIASQGAGIRTFGIISILLMGILLFATPSLAQDGPTDFSPSDAVNLFGDGVGDPFTSIFLNQLFGPLFPAVDNTTSKTVFSEIIGYFNIIILGLGGLMFFYNVTVGVMQSAHEGSVLGQRWSSLWAPLRVIFAVGLLIPVPNLGGYNLVQSGVGYVVKGSTNIASFVWAKSARMVITGAVPITYVPPTIPPKVISVMYRNAACKALVNEQLAIATPKDGTPLWIEPMPSVDEDSGSRLVETGVFGHSSGQVQNTNICGNFRTPDLPDYITRLNDEDAFTGLPSSTQIRGQVETVFVEMHEKVLTEMQAKLDAQAASMLPAMKEPSAPLPNFQGLLISLVEGGNQTLSEGVEKIMDITLGAEESVPGGTPTRKGQDARDSLLARIEGSCSGQASNDAANDQGTGDGMKCYGEGWIGAGSWYMMLAQINNELSTLTDAESSARLASYVSAIDSANSKALGVSNDALYGQAGNSQSWSGWFWGFGTDSASAGMLGDQEAQSIMNRYDMSYDISTAGLAALGFPMSSRELLELSDSVNNDGFFEKIPGFKSTAQSFMEYMVSFTSPSNFGADPMIGLTMIGKELIKWAGILMIATTVTGFFTGGGAAVAAVPLTSVMLTAGTTLAYILPMSPFFFWVLAVTGYFLLIVEAVIAVNLWALAHMRLDGDGISGEAGRQGWLMLLSLLMTPVLMVFGFLIGMTIFRITSSLLDIGFNQAISGIMGGGIFNMLIAILVYSMLLAVMYMVLVERSFSLVTEFPGRVLKWMGASAELTNGEENRARMAVGAAAAGVYTGSNKVSLAAERGAGRIGLGKQVSGGPQGQKGMLRGKIENRGSLNNKQDKPPSDSG